MRHVRRHHRHPARSASRAAPPRLGPRREVALLIETSNGYARGLLNKIMSYIREHETWSVYLGEHSRGDDPPRWLKRWRENSVIARIKNKQITTAMMASELPA